MSFSTFKKIAHSLFTLIVIVGIGYGSYVGIQFVKHMNQKKAKVSEENAIPVHTNKVMRRDMESRLNIKANVGPNESVEIKPKITGRITQLSKIDGTPTSYCTEVEAHEVIALLDQDELKSKVATAKAAYENMLAAYDVSQENLRESERELKRQQRLLESHAGTAKSVETAQSTLIRSKALAQQAMANRDQAKASLDQAQINLDETYIRAPFKGIISEKYVGTGAMVTTSTPIFKIIDMYKVKSKMQIPQNYLKNIFPKKTKVRLSSELWDQPVESVVNRIYPAIDESTRTATVEVLTPNSLVDSESRTWKFRPGTYIMGSILLNKKENVVALPVDILLRENDYYVFVVEGDKVRQQFVKLGIRDGDYIEITEGLKGNEEIVVMGQNRLHSGCSIRKVNPEVTQ